MKTAVALLCVALALITGCDDDEDSCINCPKTNATLENIWPNADLTSWTYDYQTREWEGNYTIYSTSQEAAAKPLPGWKTIFNLVQSRTPKTPFAATDHVYGMEFIGTATTHGGLTVQELTISTDVMNGESAAAGTPALTRRLYDARPDLREKILASLGGSAAADMVAAAAEWPLFVHGGPWEKTSAYIGTYSSFADRLGWKFLTNKLYVGAEFSYQLYPDLAEDLVLCCRVYRTTTITTSAGTFERALDCLYILDYGVTTVMDIYGDPIGFVRTFDYGRVIYVPNVGPVYDYERWGVQPGNPPSDGFLDITLELTASSTLEN